MLGVVGLVIGGIWVAASAVSKNNAYKREQELAINYIDRASSLFSHQTYSGGISANQAVGMGLVPAEILVGGVLRSYTNATLILTLNTTTGVINIGFNWGVLTDKSNCINLATKLAASPKLYQVSFYNQVYGMVFATAPVTFSSVTSALSSATGCPIMTASYYL